MGALSEKLKVLSINLRWVTPFDCEETDSSRLAKEAADEIDRLEAERDGWRDAYQQACVDYSGIVTQTVRQGTEITELKRELSEAVNTLNWLFIESGGNALPNSTLDAARGAALVVLRKVRVAA